MPLIAFDRVSKTFSLGGAKLMRDHASDLFRLKTRRRFWALKAVSFTLEPGESMAVIGRNGAGKSTLLSLVAGLAEPVEGSVIVNGRVAALLELGSGFHPDLTGAENLQLNASLLGLSRRRTAQLFDTIIDFSGIGDFIDQPLRTYSSGMVVRLAFSVAAHVDPNVLIVDEVLAVGDLGFQAKCFEKISELKRAGKTLLFVSHSILLVRQLCERALWLDHGEVMMDGPADEVIKAYSGSGASPVKA
jgi:ABC-type polysaccharide/polyol phosphate transport system ATPase subunit